MIQPHTNLLSRLLLTLLCHSLAVQLAKEGQKVVLPRLRVQRLCEGLMQHGRGTKDHSIPVAITFFETLSLKS